MRDVLEVRLVRAGVEIDRDAVAYLAANLGGDRGITRAELDKLVACDLLPTKAGPPPVSAAEIAQIYGKEKEAA